MTSVAPAPEAVPPVLKIGRQPAISTEPAAVHPILRKTHGAPFGVGVVELRPGRFTDQLRFDEALYCLDGEVVISSRGEDHALSVGDLLWVPKGSEITYANAQPARLLYITYPASPGAAPD